MGETYDGLPTSVSERGRLEDSRREPHGLIDDRGAECAEVLALSVSEELIKRVGSANGMGRRLTRHRVRGRMRYT